MSKHSSNRITRTALAVAIAGGLGAAIGLTGTVLAHPTPAHAASTAGGAIARSEALCRARTGSTKASRTPRRARGPATAVE